MSNAYYEPPMYATNDRWLNETPMTCLTAPIEKLPLGATAVIRVIQGLLVHGSWLRRYGVDVDAFGTVTRVTLPVRERLAAVVERDGCDLTSIRPVERREVGTCRDFALMTCAFLRATGLAARLRCGFASYLREGWEDHWVCEYWDEHVAGWHLADAQLDDVIRAACGVTFDPADVPRGVFQTAGEAWLRCRTGSDDPNNYGHGDVQGLWFMGVNVVRDAFAMNDRETSDWDTWREATPEQRTVSRHELELLDELARTPENKPGNLMPPWSCRLELNSI